MLLYQPLVHTYLSNCVQSFRRGGEQHLNCKKFRQVQGGWTRVVEGLSIWWTSKDSEPLCSRRGRTPTAKRGGGRSIVHYLHSHKQHMHSDKASRNQVQTRQGMGWLFMQPWWGCPCWRMLQTQEVCKSQWEEGSKKSHWRTDKPW